MEPAELAALNAAIRAGNTPAPETLAAAAQQPATDAAGAGLLHAAIDGHNQLALDALIAAGAELEVCAALDDELLSRVRRLAPEHEEADIAGYESFLDGAAGPVPHWQRTPLLHACRHGNAGAIEALVAAGARLGDKDAIGFDAPVLCLLSGDDALLRSFAAAFADSGRPFPVSVDLLTRIAGRPELYALVLAHGRPNATARRFQFNFACALLDHGTVETLLAAGHDVAKSTIVNSLPLVEALTSRMTWLYAHPESKRLAAALHHTYDQGSGYLVTGTDLNALVSDLESMSEDELEAWVVDGIDEEDAGPVMDSAPASVTANPRFDPVATVDERIALVDTLVQHGAELGALNAQRLEDLVSDLVLGNEPRLLEHVLGLGLDQAALARVDALAWAIQNYRFDIAVALEGLGLVCPRVEAHWMAAHDAYRDWQAASSSSHNGG